MDAAALLQAADRTMLPWLNAAARFDDQLMQTSAGRR